MRFVSGQFALIAISIVMIATGGCGYLTTWVFVRLGLISPAIMPDAAALPMTAVAMGIGGVGVIGLGLATFLFLAGAHK